MKKWNWLTLLLILSLLISGCEDEKVIEEEIPGTEKSDPEDPYLRFTQDTLFISKEGGVYKVKIESSVKYGYSQNINEIVTEDRIDLGIRDLTFETTLKDDYLEVKVEPAEAYMLKNGLVTIESKNKSLNASLVLKQEGDINKFFPTESVRQNYEYVRISFYQAYQKNSLMEAIYTGCRTINEWGWEEFTNRKLTSYNTILSEAFSMNYAAARNIAMVTELLSEYKIPETTHLKASFDCLFALSYYPLGVLWENVPYLESWNDMEVVLNAKQIPSTQLFKRLEENLQKAIEILPEYSGDELIFSKNVARGILGKLYMHQKQYEKAYNIYKHIIDSDMYGIVNKLEFTYNKGSRELIYSFDNYPESEYYKYVYPTEQVPVISYIEVLLATAECAFRMENQTEAIEYATKVLTARTRAYSEVTVEVLESLWKRELTGFLSYLDFLKRNKIAEEFLEIEEYQTRFPIPGSEIIMNPNLYQNQGY